MIYIRGGDSTKGRRLCSGQTSEKHQYRNKGDQHFKMICGVLMEIE